VQDEVYYEHYRGDAGGFKMIMSTFAGSHKHLVSGKKLGDPKLKRYTRSGVNSIDPSTRIHTDSPTSGDKHNSQRATVAAALGGKSNQNWSKTVVQADFGPVLTGFSLAVQGFSMREWWSACDSLSCSACFSHSSPSRYEHNILVWLKHGEDSKILPLGVEAKDQELLRPLSYNAFWGVLKRKKGEGIRLTYLRHPHPCEMCETLPAYEAKLKEALLAKERESDATKKSKLGKEVKRIQGLRDRRLAHRKTLDQQRAWINKNIIWDLQPGQCLVQADFVSFYNRRQQQRLPQAQLQSALWKPASTL
jgi:hypothetical protein